MTPADEPDGPLPAVHLGPGALGLGLVVTHLVDHPELFTTYLIGRPAADDVPPEKRTYMLTLRRHGEPSRQKAVADAANPHRGDDLPEALLRAVRAAPSLLITSALDDQAPARMALVDEIVAERPRGAETVLVVCENAPDPCYGVLKERHGERLTVCHSVVDRVCVTPGGPGRRDYAGRRQVIAHPTWEWVVAADDPVPQVLTSLERSGVRLTDDLEPFERRKLWLVNGLHLLLAMVARLDGRRLLWQAVGQKRFTATARPLAAAMLDAHRAEYPTFEHDESYTADRLRVFAEVDDDPVSRLLKDHLVRRDFRSHLTRLDVRVFDAARAAGRHGVSLDPFVAVLDMLDALVRDRDMFYGSTAADPATDVAIVATYRDMLREWLAEPEARQRTRRFALLLRATA